MSAFERTEVFEFLQGYLQPLGLDLENTHINEIGNLIEAQVITSRPLVDEVIHWLDVGEEPTYDVGLVGVFHEPHSFADEHRETRLRLSDLERAIRALLDSAG
ncbi:hypothetical protein SJI00_19905 [Pseudomonas sp. RP23018S]|uniref:hypothetical protein n=1 Tax=Pseudomonas sp. RP23018S TaxID=3096037 RepID=UPI002ACA02C1|nr:hypothetical protein [Pseudomonas sp. RP23018S]MDZ5605038.1 hypothetical protein [Pseudomonas sp. RP23018S]